MLPILRASGAPENWRDFAFSEIDYSERGPRELLNIEPYRCRAIMLANHEWKYIHYLGFPSQLFNLQEDPQELNDLGQSLTLNRYDSKCWRRFFSGNVPLKVGLVWIMTISWDRGRNEMRHTVLLLVSGERSENGVSQRVNGSPWISIAFACVGLLNEYFIITGVRRRTTI